MPEAARPVAEQGRLAKLTGAPITITLEGERYELAPLTLRQWAQLKRFAQERAVAEFCRLEDAMAKAGASKESLERFRARMLYAIEHPLETFPADDHEVRVERVLLSLQAAHPAITREKVEELLDADARDRIAADIAELAAAEARVKNALRARGRRARRRKATPKPSGSRSSSISGRPTAGRRSKSGA